MNQLWINGHEVTFKKAANQPDNFRYTFHTIRKGETVLINYRGKQQEAVVQKPMRKTVIVILDGHRVHRLYEELRRRI